MCMRCWNEHYGGEIMDTPAIRAAAALIDKVYEYHLTGGALHIVVDDFNVEASSVQWCLDHLADPMFGDEPPEAMAAYRRCGEALLALPDDRARASAVAFHDGYWGH